MFLSETRKHNNGNIFTVQRLDRMHIFYFLKQCMYTILTECMQEEGSEHSEIGSNLCKLYLLEFLHMYQIYINIIETYLKLAKAQDVKENSCCETQAPKT